MLLGYVRIGTEMPRPSKCCQKWGKKALGLLQEVHGAARPGKAAPDLTAKGLASMPVTPPVVVQNSSQRTHLVR